jgi:hypothetical protein
MLRAICRTCLSLASPATHEQIEEEVERSLSLWIKLGEPIWNDRSENFHPTECRML